MDNAPYKYHITSLVYPQRYTRGQTSELLEATIHYITANPGEHPSKTVGGVCGALLKNLTLLQSKMCGFLESEPISELTQKLLSKANKCAKPALMSDPGGLPYKNDGSAHRTF